MAIIHTSSANSPRTIDTRHTVAPARGMKMRKLTFMILLSPGSSTQPVFCPLSLGEVLNDGLYGRADIVDNLSTVQERQLSAVRAHVCPHIPRMTPMGTHMSVEKQSLQALESLHAARIIRRDWSTLLLFFFSYHQLSFVKEVVVGPDNIPDMLPTDKSVHNSLDKDKPQSKTTSLNPGGYFSYPGSAND
ncbi:uncharacterized protein PADG_12121 [Paracoccidioides brasiliensis Pb18]|uniref:Uncharacterized protein n=1 Tax=Paracoccidioides brasiliensis (strain Pb18) TaxID=502780 RepID=A0A0A0HWN7_PARBD|nr:uncharacterized protein PADG_12121 [Paracoccidioides brasiliensis Pb18]KGM91805.1 hypothetical protein PADG_12121 [Paracoccidioides brasiliensis Pb18]